jgi:hypothetical protein
MIYDIGYDLIFIEVGFMCLTPLSTIFQLYRGVVMFIKIKNPYLSTATFCIDLVLANITVRRAIVVVIVG